MIIIRLIIWTIELNLCKNGIFYLKTCEGHNSGEWVVQYTKLLGPFLDNCSVIRYQGALYYDYFTEHFKRQTPLEFRRQLTLCLQDNVFYFEGDLMYKQKQPLTNLFEYPPLIQKNCIQTIQCV